MNTKKEESNVQCSIINTMGNLKIAFKTDEERFSVEEMIFNLRSKDEFRHLFYHQNGRERSRLFDDMMTITFMNEDYINILKNLISKNEDTISEDIIKQCFLTKLNFKNLWEQSDYSNVVSNLVHKDCVQQNIETGVAHFNPRCYQEKNAVNIINYYEGIALNHTISQSIDKGDTYTALKGVKSFINSYQDTFTKSCQANDLEATTRLYLQENLERMVSSDYDNKGSMQDKSMIVIDSSESISLTDPNKINELKKQFHLKIRPLIMDIIDIDAMESIFTNKKSVKSSVPRDFMLYGLLVQMDKEFNTSVDLGRGVMALNYASSRLKSSYYDHIEFDMLETKKNVKDLEILLTIFRNEFYMPMLIINKAYGKAYQKVIKVNK